MAKVTSGHTKNQTLRFESPEGLPLKCRVSTYTDKQITHEPRESRFTEHTYEHTTADYMVTWRGNGRSTPSVLSVVSRWKKEVEN